MEKLEIKNKDELSKWIGLPLRRLTFVIYKKGIDNCYKVFEIPKKSGGTRIICAPSTELKVIQRQIAKKLDDYLNGTIKEGKKTNISHGFEKYKDIFTNAKIHTGKKYLLNIDIKDFFDSFHFGRVKGYFIKNKYFNFPEEVASLIANLLCYNRKLPQGAPTSPVVTNLIFNIVDFKILSLAVNGNIEM